MTGWGGPQSSASQHPLRRSRHTSWVPVCGVKSAVILQAEIHCQSRLQMNFAHVRPRGQKSPGNWRKRRMGMEIQKLCSGKQRYILVHWTDEAFFHWTATSVYAVRVPVENPLRTVVARFCSIIRKENIAMSRLVRKVYRRSGPTLLLAMHYRYLLWKI